MVTSEAVTGTASGRGGNGERGNATCLQSSCEKGSQRKRNKETVWGEFLPKERMLVLKLMGGACRDKETEQRCLLDQGPEKVPGVGSRTPAVGGHLLDSGTS